MLIKIHKRITYLGILFFLLNVFSIQRFFTSRGIFETISSYIVYPIIQMQGKISGTIERYHNTNESIAKLKNKLDELQKEKDILIFDNVRLKASLAYLEQVSELIEFKKKIDIDPLITSQIIHKQISDNGHFAFIDKGSDNSVEKDMVAIYKNCLVGKVTEVYPTYSKMIYITDNSCKISSYCSKTGASGIYEGSNNLKSASLNYVNHLHDLEMDDLIISSGEGLIFPQGFAIGKISGFEKHQIHYDVEVKPLIDVTQIKYCQLIKR